MRKLDQLLPTLSAAMQDEMKINNAGAELFGQVEYWTAPYYNTAQSEPTEYWTAPYYNSSDSSTEICRYKQNYAATVVANNLTMSASNAIGSI